MSDITISKDYFEQLLAVVEAAKAAIDRPYSMQMAMLSDTLYALEKEDV